jgi:hypothetical protein
MEAAMNWVKVLGGSFDKLDAKFAKAEIIFMRKDEVAEIDQTAEKRRERERPKDQHLTDARCFQHRCFAL